MSNGMSVHQFIIEYEKSRISVAGVVAYISIQYLVAKPIAVTNDGMKCFQSSASESDKSVPGKEDIHQI
jgi:hypothetical protein